MKKEGTPKIIAGIKIRNYLTFHSRLVILGLYGNFIILLAKNLTKNFNIIKHISDMIEKCSATDIQKFLISGSQ